MVIRDPPGRDRGATPAVSQHQSDREGSYEALQFGCFLPKVGDAQKEREQASRISYALQSVLTGWAQERDPKTVLPGPGRP